MTATDRNRELARETVTAIKKLYDAGYGLTPAEDLIAVALAVAREEGWREGSSAGYVEGRKEMDS
jgi:hypothetical protein